MNLLVPPGSFVLAQFRARTFCWYALPLDLHMQLRDTGKSLEQNLRPVLWFNIKGSLWFTKPH